MKKKQRPSTLVALAAAATLAVAPAARRTSIGASPDGPSIGACIGKHALKRIQDAANNALVARGYVTSRVLVPPQSLESMLSAFLGPNASTPYLVVSYGVRAPTAGGINGLAVLSCK